MIAAHPFSPNELGVLIHKHKYTNIQIYKYTNIDIEIHITNSMQLITQRIHSLSRVLYLSGVVFVLLYIK